jgi:hypothetical protein
MNDVQNTTQKAKHLATQTPLKIGGELRCSRILPVYRHMKYTRIILEW